MSPFVLGRGISSTVREEVLVLSAVIPLESTPVGVVSASIHALRYDSYSVPGMSYLTEFKQNPIGSVYYGENRTISGINWPMRSAENTYTSKSKRQRTFHAAVNYDRFRTTVQQ